MLRSISFRQTYRITSRFRLYNTRSSSPSFQSITDVLRREGIYTDVTPTFVDPKFFIDIKYNGVSIVPGTIMKPKHVRHKPKLHFEADKSKYYSLCMVDPDAPKPEAPANREWVHWLIVNIPGEDLTKGDEVIEYVGAAPPKGTNMHRYVFLLYEHDNEINVTGEKRISKTKAEGRAKWSSKKFAEKYKLGNPVAINIFKAEWDESVPETHKQLGF